MKKRVVGLMLIVCMLISIMSTFSVNSYAASAPSDWAKEEVYAAIRENLVTDKVTKDYQKVITREEFCELVIKLYYKLTDKSVTVRKNPFTDTYNSEVLKAYSLGIVNGVSSNKFAPNNKITRQEICVMLTRCINVAVGGSNVKSFRRNSFADGAKIADWARDSVDYAYTKEIIRGVGNNRIDPLGNTTCEQAIMLIYRVYANRVGLCDDPDYERKQAMEEVKADGFEITSWSGKSVVRKDYETTYDSDYSYCLDAKEADDLRIIKNFNVEKNKMYRISAYFKTVNVKNKESGSIGANISCGDWQTSSKTLFADNDWTKISVIAKSKDKDKLRVSFNLGYWNNTCSGTVYIDEIKCEELVGESTWKYLFVILSETDIEFRTSSGKTIKSKNTMSLQEINLLKESAKLFEADIHKYSEGKIDASVDVAVIEDPVTEVDNYGNGEIFLSQENAYKLLEKYIDIDEYDHITVFANLNMPTSYFGLGGMNFKQFTGYSFINTQSEDFALYFFDDNNCWVSGCMMHEFLHFIESLSNKLEMPIPIALHDAEEMGYTDSDEWKSWYRDFMTQKVPFENGSYTGVSPIVWNCPPRLLR